MADLLVLTPWFPNRPDGWPARFVSDSALALTARGHRVSVDVLRAWLPLGASRWAKAEHAGRIDLRSFHEIGHICCRRYPTFPKGWFRQWTNASLDAAVRRLMRASLARSRPDAIIVHTETLAPAAVDLARKLDIPILVVLHGENTNEKYLSGPGQANRFRNALSRADRLVIVGEPLRAYAASLAGRGDHIEVVYNGVKPSERIRQVPQPDDGFIRLLAVANLQEGKGVDLLLTALMRLRAAGFSNWVLGIIGAGPLESELREQVQLGGISGQVEFLGTMSNAHVLAHMAECDVFVLPSWREAFGVAYLEAMVSGLLAIGVQGQGPSQFIQDGVNGILVPPKDADALTARLAEVIAGDRRTWRGMAARGMAHVRQGFTWKAHASRMTQLIEEVTGASVRWQ